MRFLLLFMRGSNGQSLFRSIATTVTLLFATLILLVSISLGQGWVLSGQKTDLLSELAMASVANPAASNLVYVSSYSSEFDSQEIQEFGLRNTVPEQRLPAGLDNLPPAGELWVTPRLHAMIHQYPELAERYSQYSIEVKFPHKLAPSPGSLMALYTMPDSAIAESHARVTTIDNLWNRYNDYVAEQGAQKQLLNTALLMVGVVLIVPILLLVTEATRIGIVQREKRYASLSLVGASRSQIRLLIVAESLPVSLLGAGVGLSLFLLAGVPALTQVPISDGLGLWKQDMQLSPSMYVLALVVLVVCSVSSSLYSVRSVHISPLSVSRTNNDVARPRIWSIIALLVGVVALGAYYLFGNDWHKQNPEGGGIILALMLMVILIGIILSGSYMTSLIARTATRVSRGSAGTLAAWRLYATPRKSFHAVSGIVIALFVGTILMTFLTALEQTAINQYKSVQSQGVVDPYPLKTTNTVSISLPSQPNTANEIISLARQMRSQGLLADAFMQQSATDSTGEYLGLYYDSCAQFTHHTTLTCSIEPQYQQQPFVVAEHWAMNQTAASQLQYTPFDDQSEFIQNNSYFFVATDLDARQQVLNQLSTFASKYHATTNESLYLSYEQPEDYQAEIAATLQMYRTTVMVPVVITLLIGGLNIFVAVVGGVFARKRTFVRLHILGARFNTLALSLLIEVLLPLIGLSLVVIGIALVATYFIISILADAANGLIAFSIPGWLFWQSVAGALALCALMSLLVVPILARLINTDEMRAE